VKAIETAFRQLLLFGFRLLVWLLKGIYYVIVLLFILLFFLGLVVSAVLIHVPLALAIMLTDISYDYDGEVSFSDGAILLIMFAAYYLILFKIAQLPRLQSLANSANRKKEQLASWYYYDVEQKVSRFIWKLDRAIKA
jgi:hypothetical protein